jgi:hypothetical protein
LINSFINVSERINFFKLNGKLLFVLFIFLVEMIYL